MFRDRVVDEPFRVGKRLLGRRKSVSELFVCVVQFVVAERVIRRHRIVETDRFRPFQLVCVQIAFVRIFRRIQVFRIVLRESRIRRQPVRTGDDLIVVFAVSQEEQEKFRIFRILRPLCWALKMDMPSERI